MIGTSFRSKSGDLSARRISSIPFLARAFILAFRLHVNLLLTYMIGAARNGIQIEWAFVIFKGV